MDNHLIFDKKIYSKEAVLATAYWGADRFVSDINEEGDFFTVVLSPKIGQDFTDKDVEEFKLMLVHNQMRHQLSKRFAELEATIVAKAFAPVSNLRD